MTIETKTGHQIEILLLHYGPNSCSGELLNWTSKVTTYDEDDRGLTNQLDYKYNGLVHKRDKRITSKRLLHRDARRMRKASGGKVCHNFWLKKLTCLADDLWSYKISQFIWLTTKLWLLKEDVWRVTRQLADQSYCSKAGHPWDRTTALLQPVVLAIL